MKKSKKIQSKVRLQVKHELFELDYTLSQTKALRLLRNYKRNYKIGLKVNCELVK